MKKLSRIAALLAAAALLFGAAGCSGDDDDPPAKSDVTATLSAESIELEAGGEATSTATVTLAGGTFVQEVTKDSFVLTASGDSVVSTTAVKLKSDTEAEIEFSVTAAGKTESGEITVTVKAAALKDYGKDVTAAEKIAYTVEEVQLDPDFPSKTDDTTANDETTLGLVGTSATSSSPSVATAKIENGKIAITSHSAGTAVITVKDADEHTAGIKVTVAADGTITIGKITKYEANSDDDDDDDDEEENDAEWTGAPTIDSWDFTTYGEANWVNPDAAGSIVNKDATKYDSDGTYTLSKDAEVPGRDNVLTLTVASSGTGKGNTKSGTTYSFQSPEDGLRIKKDAFKIAQVKGKVVLRIEWACIAGKEADNRDLEVTIGNNGTPDKIGNAATTGGTGGNVAMPPYETEFDARSGTNVYIGAKDNLFIKTITITKQADSLTPDTNTDTKNDLKTLGLIGTDVETDDETVAVADFTGDNNETIKISSVTKAGIATITVTNKDGKTAKIPVTVASSGNITLGTIERFTRDAPTATVTKKASDEKTSDGTVTVTWDGLTDLEWSSDGNSWETKSGAAAAAEGDKTLEVTDLAKGEYYVRAAGSDEYEESEKATIKMSYEGAPLTDKWTLLGLEKIGDYTLTASAAAIAADYEMPGEEGNLYLTFSKNGTGIGKSTKSPQYKKHNSGTIIKKDAWKISGIKGNMTLTIKWGITSSKETSDRNLEVTIGKDGATTEVKSPIKDSSVQTYTADIDATSDAVDVYIGTSNELYFTEISITPKQ